ncbi:hypothetical protein C6P78_05560 [Burkholderia multivorans]|nr:hypothetical protein C6P78_05560 [Burkholderia multivorans]
MGMTQSSSVSRTPLDPIAGTEADVGFYLTFESLFPTFHFHSQRTKIGPRYLTRECRVTR